MHLSHLDLENYKGIMHMVMFLIVLFKVHVIDKKLNLLERRFVNK